MKSLNPYIIYKEMPQKLQWQHFKKKKIYEIEIILPLDAITLNYNGREAYVRQCGKNMMEQDLNVSKILKGQLIIFDFPLKTFCTAWQGISYPFRNTLNGAENVLLKFEKKNRQSMKILSYNKTKPTQEQIEFAKEYYVQVEPFVFKKTVIKESEEL